MADFRPLLQRAIAGLPENTPEARQAIYARARDALERHLGSREPAIDDADRRKEILALEDVIHALESEAPKVIPPGDASLSPAQLAEPEPAQATAPAASPPSSEPELASAPGPAADVQEKEQGKEQAEPAPQAQAEAEIFRDIPAPEAAIPLKIPERLKLPDVQSDAPRRKRLGLLVGFGCLAILAMGAVALTNRAGPEHYRKTVTQISPERPTGDITDQSKREGRLSGSEAPSAPRPAVAAQTATPAAQPSPVPQVSPSQPPARPAQPAPAASASAQPPLLVASRAFMILEGQGAAPDQFEGQANWSFAPDAGNRNGPKAVRLDVQFAAAGLKLEGSITLNTDRGIDASHTILLIFEPGDRLPAVREMSAIEWRERETVNGATLSGRLAPIQDNVFMIGLDASAAALQRNLDLLRSQKWLVFETRMANGRRGAFLIEKGSSGEKAISEALSVWK